MGAWAQSPSTAADWCTTPTGSLSYRQLGLEVPRTTGGQLRAMSRVPLSALRPGDLLFFRINGKVSHVALYTGESRFVHAPSSGKRVSFSDLENPYWKRRLVAAGRLH